MTYAARILADSISPAGHRLTSIEWTFPRFILAEVNTHRMLTKSSASSRAVPVLKRIEMILGEPFIPDVFSKNKAGMQATEVLADTENSQARELWLEAMHDMIGYAKKFAELGVHKQYANRFTELFSWHTAIITATEWQNFEALRISTDAQPEFTEAARVLQKAKAESTPAPVREGEWHLPYILPDERLGNHYEPWPHLVKLSAGRCARVSYLTQDGIRDQSKDIGLYERLATRGHMAPLEHPARPMTSSELDDYRMFEFTVQDPDGRQRIERHRTREHMRLYPGEILSERVTHFCGNFDGWVQHRKELPGEAIFGTAPALDQPLRA